MTIDASPDITRTPIVPGAYDRSTVTPRQPGGASGPPFGREGIGDTNSVDAATIEARKREGGGGR